MAKKSEKVINRCLYVILTVLFIKKSMKKFLFGIALAFGTILPIAVFAAGGGGGGSVPACSADTWSCGDWGDCSSAGTQTRTCVLTYDCPTVDTPRPPIDQSCTPPAPPAITPTSVPAATPTTSKPANHCSADTWTCANWSACDPDGVQKRHCQKTVDCPAVDTPEPVPIQKCDHLQCGNLPTLRERILCRINLSPAGVARELEIQYLPEECRADKDSTEKTDCIARYKSLQPCWNLPVGEGRLACARAVVKIGPVISDEVKTCEGKTGAEAVACKKDIREKVLYMIKFRFYDLEQRAEDLITRGAPAQTATDFVIFIEQEKQAFNNATTDDARIAVIDAVRTAWQQFVAAVKNQVR